MRIRLMPPTGGLPGRSALNIVVSLRSYEGKTPDAPQVFRRGEVADAEPAVPGWRFPVDELFT